MSVRSRFPGRSLQRRSFTLLELVIVIGIILLLLGLVLGIGSIVVGQSEQRQLRATMTIIDGALSEFKSQTGRPIVFQGHFADSRRDHCGYGARYSGFYCDANNLLPAVGVYYDVPYRPFLPVAQGGFGWEEEDDYQPWFDTSQPAQAAKQWMSATIQVLEQNATCSEMLVKADPTLVHAVQFMEGSGSANAGLRSIDIKEFVDPWGNQIYIVYPGRLWEKCDGELYGVVRDQDGTIQTEVEQSFGICRNRQPLLVSSGPDLNPGNIESDSGTDDYQASFDNIYSYEPADP